MTVAKPTLYTPEKIEEYTAKGYWTRETLASIWGRNAIEYPNKEAIADSRVGLTWQQANQWIDRLALGLLELGLKRDGVVVLQLPNSVELCLLRVACEKAGLVCLPALTTLRQREMEYILGYTEASAVIIFREYRGFNYLRMVEEIKGSLPWLKHVLLVEGDGPSGEPSVRQMVGTEIERAYPPGYLEKTQCPATEVSLVLHTTGTTGLPKFVEYPMCCRMHSSRAIIRCLHLTSQDTIAILGPAAGGPNNPAYLMAPLLPARVVILERFEAEDAFRLIEQERATVAGVVPTQLSMMAQHPSLGSYDLSSMRLWYCVGSTLPYAVGLKVESKLGGIVVPGYGATDWGGGAMVAVSDPPEVRLLTVGKPWAGEVQIVDDEGRLVESGQVGEVWGRGPCCVSGYYRDPEANRQAWTGDGWYRTGDLARWDGDGNLVIVGRKKDMIIRGGQNIYPVEIEDLLVAYPKVKDVAIVGMPDPTMGERACAYVVPKADAEFTFDEMVAFLKGSNIAAYKIPERLEIVSELPLASGQKVDKKALQGDIADKLRSEGRM
jgi:non-ribosomal peptide synthetase component E (peptide arylation enzyme)